MSILLFTVLFLYAFVLFWMATGFFRSKIFIAGNTVDTVAVTIIICARNEEKNITACLHSIIAQQYDNKLIELILVDDASTDATISLAEKILTESKINHQIIKNKTQRGKKLSITSAIAQSSHGFIITRDADTYTHSPLWLKSICDYYLVTNADLIIAPVALHERPSLLWALQTIENNVLAVITCGSAFYKNAFLCSGANLAFTKTIFEKTDGYSSHIQVSSGDDVLFLEDVKKISSKINYLKSQDAIVHTYAANDVKQLLRQKSRWASKFTINPNSFNLVFALLVFATNFCFLFSALEYLHNSDSGGDYFLFIILKLSIDILLLFLASEFIKSKFLLWFLLPVALLYPLYACIVAILSVFVKPKWKV